MSDRGDPTRLAWLAEIDSGMRGQQRPGSAKYWSPALETASRDELRSIQDRRITLLAPYLYANSAFYRRRFDRLGMLPSDIRSVDDLAKWPVVDKDEMAADAAAHPPYGTYTCVDEHVWQTSGWQLFTSSGSTGTPRIFRYTQKDRAVTAWANARALYAAGARSGDTVFMVTGYGPHVWAWGAHMGFLEMGIPMITGGGLDGAARANLLLKTEPTILLCTPSYALYLGRVLESRGVDPATTSIRSLFVAGEPSMSIEETRLRIERLWGATLREFYGCTEASPHPGGYSCEASVRDGEPVSAHLTEDIQVWELVDPHTRERVPVGERGVTVCTNIFSESSPQLRFLVGDFTSLDETPCDCGRTHVRAVPSFGGRADDIITVRGVSLYPAQFEQAVRAVPGAGDEYEVVISAGDSGMPVVCVRIEHPHFAEPAAVRQRLSDDLQARCEIRMSVEILPPGTLPKTQLKARRIVDNRAVALAAR